jgi:hypothetical protein
MASSMMDQGGMMKKGSMMDQGGMMGKDDRKELMVHLQNHIMYPATKRTIVESCAQMAHVPASTRKWVEQSLPDGTYKSADEVVMKLGM